MEIDPKVKAIFDDIALDIEKEKVFPAPQLEADLRRIDEIFLYFLDEPAITDILAGLLQLAYIFQNKVAVHLIFARFDEVNRFELFLSSRLKIYKNYTEPKIVTRETLTWLHGTLQMTPVAVYHQLIACQMSEEVLKPILSGIDYYYGWTYSYPFWLGLYQTCQTSEGTENNPFIEELIETRLHELEPKPTWLPDDLEGSDRRFDQLLADREIPDQIPILPLPTADRAVQLVIQSLQDLKALMTRDLPDPIDAEIISPLRQEYLISTLLEREELLSFTTTCHHKTFQKPCLLDPRSLDPRSLDPTSLDARSLDSACKPVRYQATREELEEERRLFRLFGPKNPYISLNADLSDGKCATSIDGDCRFFTCNDWETPDPDGEADDLDLAYYNLPDKGIDWFTGVCQTCSMPIRERWQAARCPLPEGGWQGCFCSFTCISAGYTDGTLDERTEYLIERFIKQFQEIGIVKGYKG